MLSQASALEGGFSDPVLDAQAAFRAIMDAMARPATVHSVPALVRPPAPLDPAAGAVACALIDADHRVLLAGRRACKPMAGRWEFPDGKGGGGEGVRR